MRTIESEAQLYQPVCDWLSVQLKARFPRAKVIVADVHTIALAAFVRENDLVGRFPEFNAWDIKVDLAAAVIGRRDCELVVVEVKLRAVTLKDVGQLLGYARVARPHAALLISPAGPSPSLRELLTTYGRYDILTYDAQRSVKLCKWNAHRGEVAPESVLPPGAWPLV